MEHYNYKMWIYTTTLGPTCVYRQDKCVRETQCLLRASLLRRTLER